MEKQLIIKDFECMSKEQQKDVCRFLDSCPIEYSIWIKED